MAKVESCGEILFCFRVVFLQERYDADVVLECHDVRLGELRESRHVARGGVQRAEDVFAEGDGIEFEVGFEEKIDDVVGTPFAGFLEGSTGAWLVRYMGDGERGSIPVADAQGKCPIDVPRRILQVFRLHTSPFPILVGFDRDSAEVLAGCVHDRECPVRPLSILISPHDCPTPIISPCSPSLQKLPTPRVGQE